MQNTALHQLLGIKWTLFQLKTGLTNQEHTLIKRGLLPLKRCAWYLVVNTVLLITVQIRNLSKSNLLCPKFLLKDSIFLDKPQRIQGWSACTIHDCFGTFYMWYFRIYCDSFLSLGQEKAFDKMYHDSLVGNLCPIGCFSLVLWGISPKHGMLHHNVIKLYVLMGSNIFNRETYWTSSLSY